jgi:hypothetical protein
MKRIVRLTESDLTRIVRRVISEQSQDTSIGGLYYSKTKEVKLFYHTYTSQGSAGKIVYAKNGDGDILSLECNKNSSGTNKATLKLKDDTKTAIVDVNDLTTQDWKNYC